MSDTEYKIFFEENPEAMIVYVSTGKIQHVNKAALALFGYLKNEMVVLPAKKLFSESEVNKFVDINKQVVDGMTVDLETKIVSKTGQLIPVSVKAAKIQWDGQKMVCMTLVDVSHHQMIEEALFDETNRFQMYLELASVFIVMLDTKGNVQLINKKGREILGYPEHQILNKNWFKNFIPKDEQKMLQQGFNNILLGNIKEMASFENRVVDRFGQEHLIAWQNSFIKSQDGVVKLILSSGEDITQKRIDEKKFLASEERFRRLFETSRDGILLVDSASGLIVEVNQYFLDLTGKKKDALLKQHLWELGFLPDEQMCKNRFATLQTTKEFHCDNLSLTTKKGKKIYFEFLASEYVVNEKKFIQCNIRDISDRKIALDKLKESEQRYAHLFEASNDGIVYLQDGKVLLGNKKMAQLVGFKPEELIGKNFLDFIGPDDKDFVAQRYTDRLAGKDVEDRYKFKLQSRENELIPVEVNVAIVIMGGKKGTVAIVRDMTQAMEIEKIKSDFISIASHQLRTPLTGIKWFSEILLNRKEDPLSEKQEDYLKQIAVSNERMIKLVDDLLSVSHMENAEKFVVKKENQDIVFVLKDLIKRSHLLADMKRISLVYKQSCPEGLKILVDAEKIVIVLQNIIDNAIKYSPPQSQVEIGCNKTKDWIIFFVTDHGIGIPKHQQDRIFQRFFRADNVIKTDSGTGLGLYIAKTIVDRHQGKITFESTEGKGSTFFISLPLKDKKKT